MLHVLRSVLQTLEVLEFPLKNPIRMELSPTIGNSCVFLPRLNLGFSVCFGFAFWDMVGLHGQSDPHC